MSDLVGNPKDRFSRVAAQLKHVNRYFMCTSFSLTKKAFALHDQKNNNIYSKLNRATV